MLRKAEAAVGRLAEALRQDLRMELSRQKTRILAKEPGVKRRLRARLAATGCDFEEASSRPPGGGLRLRPPHGQ
eukprot:11171903-Lingulodinium_polyedra.AAC.1